MKHNENVHVEKQNQQLTMFILPYICFLLRFLSYEGLTMCKEIYSHRIDHLGLKDSGMGFEVHLMFSSRVIDSKVLRMTIQFEGFFFL